MELSEKWIKTFETEGFAHVFEWSDPANTKYKPHKHRGRVAIFITDGSCTFDFTGEKKTIRAGQRFDIPIGVEHSAVVGEEGWNVIVGEEIEGDS